MKLIPEIITVILLTVSAASADPYKWCAVDSSGGGINCGFCSPSNNAAPLSAARVGSASRSRSFRPTYLQQQRPQHPRPTRAGAMA